MLTIFGCNNLPVIQHHATPINGYIFMYERTSAWKIPNSWKIPIISCGGVKSFPIKCSL